MVERIKRIKEEIVGVLSVLGSIYLSMSLLSYYIKTLSPFSGLQTLRNHYRISAGQ